MGDNIKKTYSVRDNVEMTDIRVEMTDEGLSRALFVGKMEMRKELAGKVWKIAWVLDLNLTC